MVVRPPNTALPHDTERALRLFPMFKLLECVGLGRVAVSGPHTWHHQDKQKLIIPTPAAKSSAAMPGASASTPSTLFSWPLPHGNAATVSLASRAVLLVVVPLSPGFLASTFPHSLDMSLETLPSSATAARPTDGVGLKDPRVQMTARPLRHGRGIGGASGGA
jgi:hypothetical protein